MDHTPGQCQFTNLSKYTNFTCEKSGAGWTAFKQCLTPVNLNPAADVGLLGGGFLKSGKRADRSQLQLQKAAHRWGVRGARTAHILRATKSRLLGVIGAARPSAFQRVAKVDLWHQFVYFLE